MTARKRAHPDMDESDQSERPPKAARADRLSNNPLIDLTVEPNPGGTISQRQTSGASNKELRINTRKRNAAPVEADAIDLLLSGQKKSLAHLRPALRTLGIENVVSRNPISACDSNFEDPGPADGLGLRMRFGYALS
jgi:hypothetical protein